MKISNLVILLLSVSLAVGLTLPGGCVSAETGAPEPESPIQIIENITPEEAFVLIEDNRGKADFVILDVRTQGGFAGGYIEDAINLDYRSENFSEELNKLDKSKTYLVYCLSGVRSRAALNIMKGLGFSEAYNMTGGIIDWEKAGFPIIK